MNRLMIFVVAFCSLLSCGVAKAAFILDDTYNIGALELSESFVSFYDYSNTVQGSSSTGYELTDTVVFMIAEYNDAFALIGLVDGTSEVGDLTSGKVFLDLTENVGTLGNMLLVDDSLDLTSSTSNQYSFTFGFGDGKNDGFIYELNDSELLSLDIVINFFRGLSNAVFLDFDGSGYDTISVGSTSNLKNFPTSVAVSEPSKVLLISFALFIMFSSRRMLSSRS